MSDGLTSMLMSLGSSMKLSNADGKMASFADAATDPIKSMALESGTDSKNVSFIDLFRGELKSFIAKDKIDNNEPITEQQLTQLAEELQQLLDRETKPTDSNHSSQLKLTKPEIQQVMTALKQWQSELQQRTDAGENSVAESQSSVSEQYLNEIESLEPSESPKDTQPIEHPEVLIAQIETASAQQLVQLTELTGLTPEQLIAVMADNSDPQLNISSPGSSDDTSTDKTQLLNQLTKMIDNATNNPAIKAQLTKIKQQIEQVNSMQSTNVLAIEQEIEQRINQPIEQLINPQLPSQVTSTDVTKEQAKEQLSNEIKKLLKMLPRKDQQQLVEQLKNEQLPANSSHNELKVANDTSLANIPSAAMINNQVSSDKNQQQLVEQLKNEQLPANSSHNEPKVANDTSLANIPSAAMSSNQVSSGKNPSKAAAAPSNIKGDDEGLASEELSEPDSKSSPKTSDNFEKIIRQMGWATASTEQTNERNSLIRQQATSQTEQQTDQTAANERAESIAAKEVVTQTKTMAEQLSQRLPLNQEAPAAKMLKERLIMMVNGNVQQAVIQLDPEELGGMSIKLQIHNDQMSIQFNVQNTQAKELLENAMGKLREMLDQQGIVLKDSDVRQNDQQQQQQQFDDSTTAGNSDQDELQTDQDAIVLTLNKQSSDGIDYYA